MKDVNTDGPDETWLSKHGGYAKDMTLRDYFAARAMQIILRDQYEDGIYVGDLDNDSEHVCARSAYIMADAMLKARDV
jgi:hypothetical protein